MAFQRQENDTTLNLKIKKEPDPVKENQIRSHWMTEIHSMNAEILENIKEEASFDDDTKTNQDLCKTILQEKFHSLHSGNLSLALHISTTVTEKTKYP